MNSADMYGLIDVSRRLWKNATGVLAPVHLDADGGLLCPMCGSQHQQEPLLRQGGKRDLACRHKHGFLETVLDD
jgi:hypothetical protein